MRPVSTQNNLVTAGSAGPQQDLSTAGSKASDSLGFMQSFDNQMSGFERAQAVEQATHAFDKSVNQACAQA